MTPVSIAPEGASGAKSLTVAVFANGKKKQIHGAVGNCKISLEAGKLAVMEWEFTGVWDAVADVALPAPTYVTTAPLRWVNGFTIAGTATKVSKYEFDLGNEVTVRTDPNAVGFGVALGQITDRKPKITIDPEAALVATTDYYGQMLAGTLLSLIATLGTTGNICTITAPKCQIVGRRKATATVWKPTTSNSPRPPTRTRAMMNTRSFLHNAKEEHLCRWQSNPANATRSY